jgi:Bacterial PH domain
MTMLDGRKLALTGLLPPQRGEVLIRETWPGVNDVPGIAGLAHTLMRTFVLAPVAWLLLAPCYFKKILPFIAKRYTLTNRRVMIRRGLKPVPTHEVGLPEIDDVRIKEGSMNGFYRTATLEIISNAQVALELPAVKDPESFRRAILNAKTSWGKSAAAATASRLAEQKA